MTRFTVWVETHQGLIDRLSILAANPNAAQLIARAPHPRAARILVSLPSNPLPTNAA